MADQIYLIGRIAMGGSESIIGFGGKDQKKIKRLENQPTNYFLIQRQPWVHVRQQRPILQHAHQVGAGDTTLNHPLLQI